MQNSQVCLSRSLGSNTSHGIACAMPGAGNELRGLVLVLGSKVQIGGSETQLKDGGMSDCRMSISESHMIFKKIL